MASSNDPLSDSGITIASDSENYSAANDELSEASTEESPPYPSSSQSSPGSPLILYSPPTIWGLLRGAAINLFLPFVNGLMLGFGELFAHEAAYRLGWNGTKIFPTHRLGTTTRRAGPGVEVRDAADGGVSRRRRDGEELDMYSALE